jgi:hypothetical protein
LGRGHKYILTNDYGMIALINEKMAILMVNTLSYYYCFGVISFFQCEGCGHYDTHERCSENYSTVLKIGKGLTCQKKIHI